MLVLVTGAQGAIGRMVIAELAGAGHDLVATDLRVPSSSSDGARWVSTDLTDAGAVRSLLRTQRPEAIVHLAAVLPTIANDDLSAALAVNAVGTQALLREAGEQGVGHVVHLSSKGVYGEGTDAYGHPHYRPVPEPTAPAPRDNYGVSKLVGEHVVRIEARRSGMRVVVLRLGSTYGPGKGARHGAFDWLSQLVQAVRDQRTVQLSAEPGARLDLVYNRDVARGVAGALAHLLDDDEPAVHTANLGSGRLIGIEDLVAAVNDVAGRQLVSTASDQGAGPVITVPQTGLLLDISTARRLFAFAPAYDLRAGLADFLAHLPA